MNFYENLVQQAVMRIHTAFIAKVISVNEKYAQVIPLMYSKSGSGVLFEPAPVTAFIPPNIKYARKNITYVASISSDGTEYETTTVLIPEELAPDDIVLCAVCERDISNAVNGIMAEPSIRHHDINDSVIIKVL